MLATNIRTLRQNKGWSQQDLADQIHVVRQTISKWESGLSVPDASLLIDLANVLDVSVADLLGETIDKSDKTDIHVLSEKLEAINLTLAKQQIKKQKIIGLTIGITMVILSVIFIALIALNSPYTKWNDPQYQVLGVIYHAFEWIYIRIYPLLMIILAGLLWFNHTKR